MARPGSAPTGVVIVTGPPASGKSYVAARLADDLALPSITKDGIKEALARQFADIDQDLSVQLGRAAWQVLWHVLEAQLEARRPVLVEGNFTAEFANARLEALGARHGFEALQVFCFADPAVLSARYAVRVNDRDVAHADAERWARSTPEDRRAAFDGAGTAWTREPASSASTRRRSIRSTTRRSASG